MSEYHLKNSSPRKKKLEIVEGINIKKIYIYYILFKFISYEHINSLAEVISVS